MKSVTSYYDVYVQSVLRGVTEYVLLYHTTVVGQASARRSIALEVEYNRLTPLAPRARPPDG